MPLTLQDIAALPRDFITPAQAAGVLGCDPNYIRIAARDCPDRLGFRIVRLGSRTKIPKIPFIEYMSGATDKK